MAKKIIKLRKLLRLPNFRALIWENDFLYASKGYALFKLDIQNIEKGKLHFQKIGIFKPDLIRCIATKNRFLNRLLRAGFHFIMKIDGKIIGLVPKHIVILNDNEERFQSIFEIKRGIRPHGMAVTPDGKLYFGEYFSNPNRIEVYIYGSEDGGDTWHIVYVFPKNTIRHVHNILFDQYEECFWVLTGDYEREPQIMKASKDWKTMDIIYRGDQQTRAVTMIFRKDKIYYATDTEVEENFIYCIERNTMKRQKVFPLPGPSIWSCEVGNCLFFSTHSEPGRSFYAYACLYGSLDGVEWYELLKWKKDIWHPRLFQYGAILLPFGKPADMCLAVTGRAVEKEDGCLNIWKIEYER